MRSVIYSMSVSLDGYIAGPDGSFDWTTPDEEVFRFFTDQTRELAAHVMGRRLYETMLYWESADQNPSLDYDTLEWASVWRPLPKVVFSTTLSAVEGNARLASGSLVEEIERLRGEPGDGDIGIGGATLAGEAAQLSDRRVPPHGQSGGGQRWHPLLPAVRAPARSRADRVSDLQLPGRLLALSRGALARRLGRVSAQAPSRAERGSARDSSISLSDRGGS